MVLKTLLKKVLLCLMFSWNFNLFPMEKESEFETDDRKIRKMLDQSELAKRELRLSREAFLTNCSTCINKRNIPIIRNLLESLSIDWNAFDRYPLFQGLYRDYVIAVIDFDKNELDLLRFVLELDLDKVSIPGLSFPTQRLDIEAAMENAQQRLGLAKQMLQEMDADFSCSLNH